VQAVLGLGGLEGEEAKIARQMKMADALRNAAPGMSKSHSDLNTPNWAGALAGVYSNYKAGQYENAANEGLTNVGNQRQRVYRDFFESQRKKGAAGPADSATAPTV